MKKILLMALLVSLTVPQILQAQVFFPADDSRIQYFGRWDMTTTTAPSHSWPGVYIYAEFEGTSIGARFNDNFNYYNVIIDGELANIFHGTSAGATDYQLIVGLEDTHHTLLLTKRSETGWTSHSFYGFTLEVGRSLLEPMERPARKIEFIGDSFTSASGNEAPTEEAPADMAFFTNTYEGFGPIIARNYDAQYHMTSISGIGLVLDYTGSYAGNLPDKFNRTRIQSADPVWDFEQWIPNLVVIGLGLNDYSGFGGWNGDLVEAETELYKSRYHAFMAIIRDLYPGVKILAVATHVDWMRTTISEIVNEERMNGNLDVSYAQYSHYAGGYVNNGHPNVATHHGIAEELISYIDSIDAWVPFIDTIPPAIIAYPDTPFVAYDETFEIEVVTDSYATVKYDLTDGAYQEMAYTFTVTGYRDHSLIFSGEHGVDYTLYLKASDQSGNISLNATMISFGVDTTKMMLNWNDVAYDQTAWETGSARFGMAGGPDVVTSISDVNAVYFRKEIELENPQALTAFGILIKGSDGALVHLNGTEIGRINMFDSEHVDFESFAVEADILNQMIVVTDPARLALLRGGTNVIGVEMHRAQVGSNGVAFDCQMINQIYQPIFTLGSEWAFFDAGSTPAPMIVDKTTAIDQPVNQPSEFVLLNNFPNPFNPGTTIEYKLPELSQVSLIIYDIAGREVQTLVSTRQSPGAYQVNWNGFDKHGKQVSTGMYLARLQAGDYKDVVKMLYLK